MLIDARTVAANEPLQTDVCIVGGGAAGITIANEFIGHGARVVLLESGGFALREATQSLYQGAPSALHYHALDACRFRFLGGSTNYWGGWCRPLDSLDFEERDWVPHSGWPFCRKALEPEYERAQRVCRLGPFDYAAEAWKGASEASLLTPGARHFGDTVFQIAPVRFGEAYRAALQHSTNVRVLLNANAVEVVMDHEQRTATSVRAATLSGNSLEIRAGVVIVAAGGIENARLLLASRGTRRCGIGNEHDLVGRFFADHLHVPIGTVRPGPGQRSRFYQSHAVGGVTVRGGMSLSEPSRRTRRLLGCGVTLHNIRDPHDVLSIDQNPHHYQSMRALVASLSRFERPDRFTHHLKNAVRRPDRVVSASFRKLVAPAPRTLMVGVRSEQIPNRESRVVLDDSTDRFGMPRVRVDWMLTEQDLDNVRRAGTLLRSELAAGLGDSFAATDWSPRKIAGGAHHMGTTRMHTDPRLGVVDEHCRIHATSNVYVAGSSVFPTGGWAPPTLTIVALALRLADHVKHVGLAGGG